MEPTTKLFTTATVGALLAPTATAGNAGGATAAITGISYDSRLTRPGDVFFALPGKHTSGMRYVAAAVTAGARAVVCEEPVDESPDMAVRECLDTVAWWRVADVRRAMSLVAHEFFGRPSHSLAVVGVTGTDGKSSVVAFLFQMACALGLRAGFLSTVAFNRGDDTVENPFRQSTPEAPEIQRMLAEMRDNGLDWAFVEATSHGLSHQTQRLADVRFSGAVMTNVTHEHLEFHGSWEQYRFDKANLFRQLRAGDDATTGGPPAFAVVNHDDPSADYFAAAVPGDRQGAVADSSDAVTLYRYSATAAPGADLRAVGATADLSGTTFRLECGEDRAAVRLGLIGDYNVDNVLAAIAAMAAVSNRPPTALVDIAATLAAVKGRMQPIITNRPFRVIVDYAHTPGAFRRILPFVRRNTGGRLIVVFGSGGERDVIKRAEQGRIAGEYADIVVVTDEDPRWEDAAAIIDQIAAGVHGAAHRQADHRLYRIVGRRRAIATALSNAQPGDSVLLLGKGHESSIIIGDTKTPWDEAGVATAVLHALPR